MESVGVEQFQVAAEAARSRRRRAWLHYVERAIIYTLLSAGALLFLFPLWWMLSTSLKNLEQTFPDVGTPVVEQILPNPVVFQNYLDILTSSAWHTYFLNSIVMTLGSVIGQVITASLAAFAFARLRWPGRDGMFILVLATMMLPYQVTLIPQFLIFSGKAPLPLPVITNTFWPFWFPSFLGGGAFSIFLLRQFMLGLPIELDEAATIDGAGPGTIYARLIVPQMFPALATVAIFAMQAHWNALLQPVVYLSKTANFTVVQGLLQYQTQSEVEWNQLMAASVLVMLPPLLLFFFAQRYFIEGISLTGIKG